MALDWDPEIDTPATIAVIGGGPIGVEAALYARFLGYFVILLDAAKVGGQLLGWGNQLMPGTWGEVTSSLGIAALEAQGLSGQLPTANDQLTYGDYLEKYLLPVARTDLLYESVEINSPVISVSRLGCSEGASLPIEKRAEQEFRLLIDSKQRGQYSQLVDIVLDCSGLAARRGMATGFGLAAGENLHQSDMKTGKVDVRGKRRDAYAGKRTLLVGNGYDACSNALEFAELVEEADGTRLTWIIPKQIGQSDELQLPPQFRERLNLPLGKLIQGEQVGVVPLKAWGIEAVQRGEEWSVCVQVGEEETLDIRCDEVLNCSPATAEWGFLHGLAAAKEAHDTATAEPHYYVLGQKKTGPQCCAIADGLQQVRSTFAMIGGRENLNLYETISSQQK
jgi:hypothetical protein